MVTPAGGVVICYEVREREGSGQMCDDEKNSMWSMREDGGLWDVGTYESLADGVGNLNSSVDIRLSCAGTGDAVENVLDISGTCAEAGIIAGRARAGGDFARHEAWFRAICGVRYIRMQKDGRG